MRRSKADTAESRRQIVAAASRLLRQRGPDRVSVAEVMQAAGMTHGGFYKHFESKDALLVAAIAEAFREKVAFLKSESAQDPDAARRNYAQSYLTPEHVDDLMNGCPIAGMTGDAVRSSGPISEALAAGAQATMEAFAGSDAATEAMRAGPIRSLSMMIGGLILARAVVDPSIRDEILRAVRQ